MSSQILHNNYLKEGNYLTVTPSSEASGFPIENAFDEPRRTTIWRTAGHYYIPASYTIRFEETASTPLEATITSGDYSSFTALATEIKTQLEVVGASTYTVSQNATSKLITITSNGAGGGGVFNLLWSSSVQMAGLLGFGASDLTGALSYTSSVPKTSTSEYIFVDFGGPVNPDIAVFSWRSDQNTNISPNATCLLEGSHSNNFVTVPFSTSGTFSDYGFVLKKASTSDDGIATTGYRYWRFSIIDSENTLGYIDIGSIYIGDYMNFTRGAVQFPFTMGFEAESSRQVTYSGSVIANKKYVTRTFSLDWFALTQAEKEDLDDFFRETSTVEPFYILLDQNSVVGLETEKSLIYSRFTSPISWTMDFPGVFSADMSLREDI